MLTKEKLMRDFSLASKNSLDLNSDANYVEVECYEDKKIVIEKAEGKCWIKLLHQNGQGGVYPVHEISEEEYGKLFSEYCSSTE